MSVITRRDPARASMTDTDYDEDEDDLGDAEVVVER
jgi:hypothetical protein